MQEYEMAIGDFTFTYENFNYNVNYKGECICSEFVTGVFPTETEFKNYCKSLYPKLKNKYEEKE